MSHHDAPARRSPPWLRVSVLLALGLLCFLARVSAPRDSAALDLDQTYQQVLGVALRQGLRFGREIVFTSGPLAYFSWSPFDPQLYAQKLWLWEVLFGVCVAFLLFLRLARRGTWLDIAVGAVILIVLPMPEDAWLFAVGLLACELELDAAPEAKPGIRGWLRALPRLLAMLVLSLLTLVKVTSLTFALVCVAILALRAASSAGLRGALRCLGAFALVQCLVWVCIGQKLQDLPAYFSSSIELASGFDSAMSQPPTLLAIVLCCLCLSIGAILCAVYARDARLASGSWKLDAARAQALLVAAALLLAYKAGFTRASDHTVTFFSAAMIAPLFLVPFGPAPDPLAAWNNSRLRCGVSLLTAVCAMATTTIGMNSPSETVMACANRMRNALTWISHPDVVRQALENSRARLAAKHGLPRTKAIVGARSISAFAQGDGVIFLNDLRWKPRPVFQSFSVFTQRTARENAAFLASSAGPDFVLWRDGFIDLRLASSEDPLSLQVLLRDFRLRANESEFLLLERAVGRTSGPRTLAARGEVGWGERFELPAEDAPLVFEARIRPSLRGKLRGALYQTPEVFVDLEFASGEVGTRRIAPFALQAGVVLQPWLPTKEDWIAFARGKPNTHVVAMRFRTPVASAFAARIPWEIQRAPELAARDLEPARAFELVLGGAGDLPLRYESEVAPEFAAWGVEPVMAFAQTPARLVFAAGPGSVRLKVRLTVPPWIAGAPGFAGVSAIVLAKEADSARECARFELGSGVGDHPSPTSRIDLEVSFESAGELILDLQPAPGGDPATARVGFCDLRVGR
ncbi:MAG: hypothetical protein ABI054_03765 [Planctomycetota bacterium]